MFGGSYFAGSAFGQSVFSITLELVEGQWSFGGNYFGASSFGDYGVWYGTIQQHTDTSSLVGPIFGGVCFGQFGFQTGGFPAIQFDYYIPRMFGGSTFGDYGTWIVDFPYPGIQGRAHIKRGDIRHRDLRGKTRISRHNLVVKLSPTIKGVSRIK